MRRFTADASHEIRNPLSVQPSRAGGCAPAPARCREGARHVIHENLQEIERLQAVLEGLLTLAREVPGWSPSPDRVGAGGPLRARRADGRHVRDCGRRAPDRIDRDIEPDLEVQGDAHLLRLVAFNLLDNALKHSPTDATVRVVLAGRDDTVGLAVADQGPGVAPENRERLFRRYSRAVRRGRGSPAWVAWA